MPKAFALFFFPSLFYVLPIANAQIVTQFNFNNSTNTPNIGTGTFGLYGTATGATTYVSQSGSSDPGTATSGSVTTTGYPAQGANSGTAGVKVTVSTAGQSNLVFRYDQQTSATGSKFFRVDYTLDGGTTYVTGQVFSSNIGGVLFYTDRTLDLSGIAGANNNANFGIRIVSIFDPANGTSYTGAGTFSSQTSSAYGTTGSGTNRFDMVTLTAGSAFTGTGPDTLLSTGANFGGTAPTTSGTILFGTGAGINTTATTDPAGTTVDQILFQAAAPAFTVNGTGTLTLNAGLVNNSATTAVQTINAPIQFGLNNTIQNNGTTVFNGSVGFTTTLTLQGSGLTTFNGTVTGTTLRVAPSSTLGGTGTLATATTVYTGATLAPGNAGSTGTLNSGGAVNLLTGTNYAIRLTGVANDGVNADPTTGANSGGTLPSPMFNNYLNVTSGTLTLSQTMNITIDGTGTNFTPGQIYSYVIAQAPTIAGVTTTAPITDQARFTTVGFSASNYSLTANASNTQLYLNFTAAVPEPGTVLAVGAAGLGLVGWVRRRRAK